MYSVTAPMVYHLKQGAWTWLQLLKLLLVGSLAVGRTAAGTAVNTEWIYENVLLAKDAPSSHVDVDEEQAVLQSQSLKQAPSPPPLDRFLQNNNNIDDSDTITPDTTLLPPDHHICEAALDVQPGGPGDEIYLLNEDTNNLDLSIERRFPCDKYAYDNYQMFYYKFIGTGNAFYITTCQYPLPVTTTGNETVHTELEMAANFNCSDWETQPTCVADKSGNKRQCPNQTEGVSFAFVTTPNTDYTFGVRAWGGNGRFTLKVGELEPPEEIPNSCEEPEEIVLPPINTTGATVSDPVFSSTVLLRDNYGIYNTEYEDICGPSWSYNHYFAGGRWFVMNAPEVAAKIHISTCSNETTLHSTWLTIMLVRDNAPNALNATASSSLCNSESLMCLVREYYGHGCDDYGSGESGGGRRLASETITTKPGEQYYIYVSNQHAFDYGNFLLNITVEVPPSLYLLYQDEDRKREKRRPGVTCDPNSPYSWDTGPLECRDACLYCEEAADNSVFGSNICFNRTDFINLDRSYNATFVGYHLSIDHHKGRDETFFYAELLHDDDDNSNACRVFLRGVECVGCEKQECGSPRINCQNVPGIKGSPWDHNTLDLCQATTSVFSFEPHDHNRDGTCDTFLSELACDNNAKDLALEGLTCSCNLDQEDGSSNLVCHTECGVFCNQNQTVCGIRNVDDVFYANGEVDKRKRDFTYVLGGPQDSGPYNLYQSGRYCRLGKGWSDCDECEPKQCDDGGEDDGTLVSPLGLGVVLDCSNREGGGEYDTCDADLHLEAGPFQFLSREFDECLDIVPSNARCHNAIAMQLNESVVASNAYVPKADYLESFCGHTDAGLYYSIQGNGGWFRASTCNNVTNFYNSIRLVEGSSCDEEMNTTTCRNDLWAGTCGDNGRILEWKTNPGQDYLLFVGGYNKGTFKLEIEEFQWIDPLTHCNNKLGAMTKPNDYDCDCIFYDEYEVAALECYSSCERCGYSEDEVTSAPLFCADLSWGTAFDSGGAYRTRKVLNVTGLGFNATVAFDMVLEDFCRAAIGDYNDPVACDCEMVHCDDGSMTGALNCSEYGEGFFINLCDDQTPPENVLSVLVGEHYGECNGDFNGNSYTNLPPENDDPAQPAADTEEQGMQQVAKSQKTNAKQKQTSDITDSVPLDEVEVHGSRAEATAGSLRVLVILQLLLLF